MTGAERQVLKIVKQLKNANEETIAVRMGVSIDCVNNLCSSLMQEGFLAQLAGEYKVTSKSSAVHLKTGSRLMPTAQPGKYETYNIDKKEVEMKEGQLHRSERKYCEGEIIGEIKMKCNEPPREKVEIALKRNPQFSYEQMQAQMSSHTLFCPAKGKEVSWHYCSHCPHQDGIELQQWTVQCKYEFSERNLDMEYEEEEHANLPRVKCPTFDKLVTVDQCMDCRYQRGREWQYQSKKKGVVGWVQCGAPSRLEPKDKEARKVVYGEKEMLMVPPKWE